MILLLLFIVCLVIAMLYMLPTDNYIGGKDDSLQDTIYKKYKYLIPKGKMSFNEFCYPDEYAIQPQQIFAGEYMSPPKTRELLVFHKIGAGKTCLSIQIAEKWLKYGKPLVVMPASLIPGFRNELRSPCAGDKYITDDERLALNTDDYSKIIKASDARIDKRYNIMSYNKFIMDYEHVNSPIIIVDEVQNINNVKGTFFRAILDWINSHPKSSVVIMSGTPIFDNSRELYGLMKLLRIRHNIDNIEPKHIKTLFSGKVSYFAGAPKFTFPKTELIIKQCVMSAFQLKWYNSQYESDIKLYGSRESIVSNEINNNFYIKTRQRSNVVYPRGLYGKDGFKHMTTDLIVNHLQTYSTKITALLKKLRKGQLSFIYTNFTGFHGIKFIEQVLCKHGYKSYHDHGAGKKRYAIWSGDQSNTQKDKIRHHFNSTDNDDASNIQIIIGSPSIKEGVTLLRVRQVHVLECYWNHSRLAQIFGRAIRYCSHKSVSTDERQVSIYIYAAVNKKYVNFQSMKSMSPSQSIDLYMLRIADEKKLICDKYLKELIDCAVDKYLWT